MRFLPRPVVEDCRSGDKVQGCVALALTIFPRLNPLWHTSLDHDPQDGSLTGGDLWRLLSPTHLGATYELTCQE